MADVPLCKCHNEPMIFHHDRNRAIQPEIGRPGFWRCRIKKQARDRRYGHSDKGRRQNRDRVRRYSGTDKGRRTIRLKVARATFKERAVRIEALEKELSHTGIPE